MHRQQYKNIICHIFNRGVSRDKIFLDKEDYFFYLRRIKKYKKLYSIEFINYTLMPNHYHYMIRQLEDGLSVSGAPKAPDTFTTPISKFMHALHNSYVHYFNKKYKRAGHLFQDRYKQKVVDDDTYILWLSAYINANAKIHSLVKDARDWPYSSYLDYIEQREGTICNKEIILQYFKSVSDYSDYVNEVAEMCKGRKETLKEAEFDLAW